MTSLSEQLYACLRQGGADFFVSVPCKYLAELITIVEKDGGVTYTPVTREEEGMGLLAGAYIAGRRPSIIMQNTGLGNCVNAICSLINYYHIPIIFVVSHRGTTGELIDAQRPLAAVTTDLLRLLNIDVVVLGKPAELATVSSRVADAYRNERSLALLFPVKFWQQTQELE